MSDQPRPDLSNLSNLLQDVEEESELDKIFERLMKDENIHHLTQLSREEANAFSTLFVLADQYDLIILKKWLFNQLKLRVSLDRRGRAEFVRIAQRQPDMIEKRPWFSFRRE